MTSQRKQCLSLFFLSILFITGIGGGVSADVNEIRYVVFMRAPQRGFNQARPATFSEQNFTEITNQFQSADTVKIGIGAIFSYFKTNPDLTAESLRRFLSVSQKTNTPIMVKLDGEQWWQNRPDLWNWWDPGLPGYDPNNRYNVEWTGWGPEGALKIAWRNWGSQIRVLPPPNLLSPRYRQACHEQMSILIPIILDWHKALGKSQKHLLIGINVGWESSIGINAYYYPNGNDLLNKPESLDPRGGINMADTLGRGVVQIGYAAVKTGGIRSKGDITEADLCRIVSMHLTDLSMYAAGLGVARDKLFTHGVGNDKGELLYDAAINSYACPGWSCYAYADDPSRDPGIKRGIQNSDAPYWAAVEWLLLKPFKKDLWRNAIENTLNMPKCKFIAIYNWEGVRDHAEVKQAVNEILAAASHTQGEK
jgi:hypothetical protein